MIKYKFPDPPLSGAVCPNCGKKSWEEFGYGDLREAALEYEKERKMKNE